MAFKPNYNQQRADRNRAKAQKKQEKLKRLEEETAKRKAARAEHLREKLGLSRISWRETGAKIARLAERAL